MNEKSRLRSEVLKVRMKFARFFLRSAQRISPAHDFMIEINSLVRDRLPRDYVTAVGADFLLENLYDMARDDAVLRGRLAKVTVPRMLRQLYPIIMADASLCEYLADEGIEDLHAQLHRIASQLNLPLAQRQSGYSQEGEDLFVARMFAEQPTGFYVDVGAHHPFRFSNTYLLYQRGWYGLNIDAMPGSMQAFHRWRPRDINVECLISSDSRSLRFFQYFEPALNTVDEAVVKRREIEVPHYRVQNVVTLEARPLATVLAEHVPPGQAIDLMNVDVEGHDLDVLRSNDWEKFRPRVLIAELIGTRLEQMLDTEIYRLLRDKGYGLHAKLYNSAIFIAD